MKNTTKKRMSQKSFVCIWTPILAVIVAAAIIATCMMNAYSGVLDTVLGKGKSTVVQAEGSDQWDTNYYEKKYANADEALKAAVEASRQAGNEGFVLMKNGSGEGEGFLPLESGASVTPLGYRYLNPVYSVLGSGAVYDGMTSYTVTNSYSETIEGAVGSTFLVNATMVDAMKAGTADQIGEAPGTTPAQTLPSINACTGGNTFLTEYPLSVYESAAQSCSDTVGLVFIGREAGEGGNEKMDAYADGTPHQLALSANERAMIRFAKENCTKGVVVVVNSCSLMEIGDLMEGDLEVDAIVWIGYPGCIGAQSLADLLCGKENFSGRTVDLWPTDLTADPTYVNTAASRYSNVEIDIEGTVQNAPFAEYEEGIYVGYRYYETAAEVSSRFDYDQAVVVPFGYGLSYTSFTQEIASFSDSGTDITVNVKVTNTGKTAGKEVVQLYYTAPYTDYDRANEIEKSVVNLAAFAKTGLLQPGSSESVTLSFSKEDMASYSYTHDNGDGTTGCYMLEEGSYNISLRNNSHDVIDSRTTSVDKTIWYTAANPRQSEKDGQSILDDEGNPTGVPARSQLDPDAEFVAATNHFDEVTAYMHNGKVTRLTRADWDNTFPTAPTDADKLADDSIVYTLLHYHTSNYDVNTDPYFGNVSGSAVYTETAPASKAQNGLTVASMRGKDYYDPDWELLLDQIDYGNIDELTLLLYGGAYNIRGLTSIGLPASTSAEGPSGIGLFADLLFNYFGGKTDMPDTCAYVANMVIASTWNVDIAYACGEAVGQEAMFYPEEGDPIRGWTGPGANLHRSPFNGRNGEYYSEDPLLSGTILTAHINGAADQGLIVIFKHLAVNNTEDHRGDMCVWADEQTLRELYLPTFEKVFEETRRTVKYISDSNGTVSTRIIRGANSVMASMNCIGAIAAGNNHELIEDVLRNEWGFQGFVQSDMPTHSDKDLLLRSGADMEMNMSAAAGADMTSPTMQNVMRRAIHNIAFAVANSSAMIGIAPGSFVVTEESPWSVALKVGDIVIGLVVLAIVALMILRGIDAKKHPENYRSKKVKKA